MSKVRVVDAGTDHDEDAAAGELAEAGLDGGPVARALEDDVRRPVTTCARAPRTGTPRGRPGRRRRSAPRSAARRRRPSCGSTTVMSSMPIDRRAATLRAPMGPAPKTMTRVAGRHARAGDAVQRHRQRLGQRGMAGREALGQAQDAGGPRTGCTRRRRRRLWSPLMLLRFSHCEGLPSRQRRQVPQRGDAPPTTSSPTDQPVTSSPTAAMVPLHSWPATAPGVKPQPSRSWWMSDPQMPHECTRTTTWSGAGPRDRRSSTVMTPGDW